MGTCLAACAGALAPTPPPEGPRSPCAQAAPGQLPGSELAVAGGGVVKLRSLWLRAATLISASALGFVACNGSEDPVIEPPQPVIASPAEGSTFKAGDTLVF